MGGAMRLVAAIVGVTAMVGAATPASAEPVDVAPPFDLGFSYESCSPPAALSQYRYPTGVCEAEANAEAPTGRLGSKLRLASPAFGLLSFVSSGQTDATLYDTHELPVPAATVRYTVAIHLDAARIHTDSLPTSKTTAYASLDVSARDRRWGYGHTATRLLCTCELRDRSGEDVTLEFTMRSERGELITGPVEFEVMIQTGAWVGPGRLALDLDAVVQRVTAEPLP